MESLFVKIVCVGFFITCVTVFYEEVYEYAHLKVYGNPYWLNISQLSADCTCDGGKTRNCYPHLDESELCGKCFATCPEKRKDDEEKAKRSDDLVFGLSAKLHDVNRLLVLVASIHRLFPTSKLIIFDQENGVGVVFVTRGHSLSPANPIHFVETLKTALEHQLISIRNVEVVNLKTSEKVINNIYTPFYLQEILSRHSTVLWLTHDVEILNTKLMQAGPFRRSSKSAVTYISHDSRRKITNSGYRPYFPSSSVMPSFPMVVLLKNEAKRLISWVEQCAKTPECWKCDTSSGVSEDCTWMVLHQVASDAKQLRVIGDVNESIHKQSWGPPECDFYCAMYLISITIVAVVCFGALALVLLKNSTKKTA